MLTTARETREGLSPTTSKLAIVTGSSRGIGRALAAAMLAAGWRVAGLARGDQGELTSHPAFRALAVDLADPAAAVAALGLALGDAGATEELCLINNAGSVAPVAPVGALPLDVLTTSIQANLASAIALTNAFLRQTKSATAQRRVVNITSGAAHTAYAGWSVYCATKAGLDHFTRCVALEQAGATHPVRIAAVAPGVVDTAMQGELRATDAADFPMRQRFVDLHASGNLQSAAAVATRLLAYMDSPAFGDPPVVDLRSL